MIIVVPDAATTTAPAAVDPGDTVAIWGAAARSGSSRSRALGCSAPSA
jgi:hypothetical protein